MSTFCEAIRTCRVCGCTDDDCTRCVERTGSPYWWVAADWCSACVGVPPGRVRRLAAQAVLRRRLQARAPEGGR
jgi:hypothetical protein